MKYTRREKSIEAKLVKMISERGGLCFKFMSPDNPGVPDQIIITPNGRILFVEIKSEIGSLQRIQRWQIDRMQARNCAVRVLKGLDQVKAFIAELFPKGGAPD